MKCTIKCAGGCAILLAMKKLIVIQSLLMIALGAAVWYLKFAGAMLAEI